MKRRMTCQFGCMHHRKVHFFLWLVFNERLLTHAYRALWRPEDNVACGLCEFAPGLPPPSTTCGPWEVVLSRCEDRSTRGKILQSLVPEVMWALWLGRNDKIFGGVAVSAEGMWEGAKRCIASFKKSCVVGGDEEPLTNRECGAFSASSDVVCKCSEAMVRETVVASESSSKCLWQK
ncbi:hypothetical protein QJS10_CPB15g00961 [Acorus calamus]|uniref:Reverse transcriptase zinc-binding domain-containing protein n=1 Tax=Acorus calamus TaxID=4465 RepID=A0AAV9D6Y9_ACOCL|nr:hypothetical protein QJS10_CPB15g00961 [Acorus calamus]